MKRILMFVGLLIAISVLAILFVAREFLYPLMDPLVIMIAAAFVVVFGFLVGIKLMSDI
jgi:hypothetical protein